MKQQQSGSIQEIKQKENSVSDFTKEHQLLIQKIDNNKNEIEKTEQEIERIKTESNEYRERIDSLERELTEKINTTEKEIQDLQNEITFTQRKNGILSFLLEESAEDIPEVEILAYLMKNGRSTLSLASRRTGETT